MQFKSINYKTTIKGVKLYEGESIEEKVCRITTTKEPIKDSSPMIYTDRKDGVEAQYDIRTDRFEVAIGAMDIVHKSKLAQREERHKASENKDGKAESIQGTEQGNTPAA